MSTVSLQAGNTSWCDSITCDSCGVKVERVGTGVMTRVQLSISDPRHRAPFQLQEDLEIEYERREFKKGALEGWGRFELHNAAGNLGFDGGVELYRSMDLCPDCTQVHCDALLERVSDPKSNAPFGTREEVKYGTEVPRAPWNYAFGSPNEYSPHDLNGAMDLYPASEGSGPVFQGMTNEIFARGYMLSSQPIPHLRSAPPGPCIWRTGGGSTQICGRPAVAGDWHCDEHTRRP